MKRYLLLVGSTLMSLFLMAGCSNSTTHSPTRNSTSYTPTVAAQYGDVVVGLDGKITNLSAFTSFLDHFEQHKSATVQITRYTTEGDPIITYLSFDGKVFQYTYDNSQDQYGGQTKGRRTSTCIGVSSYQVTNGTMYVVSGCQDTNFPDEILVVPTSQN